MYCNVYNKYRKSKKNEIKHHILYHISYIFKETLNLSIVYSKCVLLFKEEQSIEILKILGAINNIDEYQKIYDHV